MFRFRIVFSIAFTLIFISMSCATPKHKVHKFKKTRNHFRKYDCGCQLLIPHTTSTFRYA
jgi:hypothetical protein